MSANASTQTDEQATDQPDVRAMIQEVRDDFHEKLDEMREEFQQKLDKKEEELQAAEERIQELEAKVDDHEERVTKASARIDAVAKSADDSESRIAELQSRELEKGAHLRLENVEFWEEDLDVAEDRLERFEKEDGTYTRIPGQDDPLNRGGETQLSHGDLLPIQQLAQLDDEMLASENKPVRLAAEVWQEHDSVGPASLWSHGAGEVRQYIDASDLKQWILIKEDGVNDEYAQKLASRTIKQLIEKSNNRLVTYQVEHSKDGLHYNETRLEWRSGTEIPGVTEGGEQ